MLIFPQTRPVYQGTLIFKVSQSSVLQWLNVGLVGNFIQQVALITLQERRGSPAIYL